MVKIVGREVGATGFGLMSLTPPTGPLPQAQAFAAMDAALETGAVFWNGGQLYGTPDYNSLHLLRDYFSQRLGAADQVVLSIKGGMTNQRFPDGSAAFVRKSVDECLGTLPPELKKIDIFECARVDPNVPVETTLEALKTLVQEGKIGAIGLSEVSARTIRRAWDVVPVAAVEVEFSLFETSILSNSVANTCSSLGIPVIAYSPLGRGILTGGITTPDDIPATSLLTRLDKLQGDNLKQNLRLVHALQRLSEEYSPRTMAQLALSWLRQISGRSGLPIILPISGSSRQENVRSNAVHVDLDEDTLRRIAVILKENETIGYRGYGEQKKYLEG